MDYNNDGRMDLIIGSYYGKLYLYRRLPDGTLTEEPKLCYDDTEIDMGYWCAPQLVDWNENGHLDLLLSAYTAGAYSNRFTLLMNTNDYADSPVFTTSGISKLDNISKQWGQGVRVFDLNRDGKKDLVSGYNTGLIFFYENKGTNVAPVFKKKTNLATAAGTIDIGSRARACIFDWNADGTPDMIVGESTGKMYLVVGIPGVGVEEVTTEAIEDAVISLAVMENPVTGALIPVEITSSESGEAFASLYDIQGRLICEQQYGISAGSNSIYLNGIDASPGVALLRVVFGNTSVSEVIVITR